MTTRVTYLDHSGFAVERPEVILVFDYYKDPTKSLEKILRDNPDKPVVFFVSHHHEDHFNTSIFHLAQNHKRMYVLSDDVLGKYVKDDLDVAYLRAGDTIEDILGGITVNAFGSTDAGVSYLVTFKDGETLFHAGDLNYWHWQDESDLKEVKEAYGRFVHEMNRVMEKVKNIDIVFFPVDPRLGTDYASGARLFMENINVKNFFPMHFGTDKNAACDFEDYATDNTDCHCLYAPGQHYDLHT